MRPVENEEIQFPTEAAMVARLHSLLTASGLDDGTSPTCANSLAKLYTSSFTLRQPSRDYALITKHWAIRADDLAILELTAPIAVSVAAMTFEPHSPAALATFVSSTLLSVLMIHHRLRAHAAPLKGLDYEVLTALKSQRGPMELEAILDHLRSKSAIREVDESIVLDSLSRLASVTTPSGQHAPLAMDSGQGAWHAGKI